jgi:hypothetical protein
MVYGRYVFTALAASIYWFVVAWLSFRICGLDPIDAARGGGALQQRAIALAVIMVSVMVFAALNWQAGLRRITTRVE